MKKLLILLTIILVALASQAQNKDSLAFVALQKEANEFLDSLKKSTTLEKFISWADGELTSKAFRSLDSLLKGIKIPATSNIEKALEYSYENVSAKKHDRFLGFYNYFFRVHYDKWYAKKTKPL